MLVLTRSDSETVIIKCGDEVIKVTVVELRGPKVRLGFEATKAVEIHREEIWNRILVERGQATEA